MKKIKRLLAFFIIGLFLSNNILTYADAGINLYQENAREIFLGTNISNSSATKGSRENPFTNINEAVNFANNGDSLLILDSIVYSNSTDLIINKNLTIKSANDDVRATLQIRGVDLILRNNINFKNLNISYLRDGNIIPTIYIEDSAVVFDNITTLVSSMQSNERPNLVLGKKSGLNLEGTSTSFTLLNSKTDTKFENIYLGNKDTEKTTETSLILDRGFRQASSKNNIIFSSVNNGAISSRVNLISASNYVNNFTSLSSSSNNNFEFDNVNVRLENISGMNSINLKNSSNLTVGANTFEKIDTLNIEAGSKFNISDDNENELNLIKNLSGEGNLVLPFKENILRVDNLLANTKISLDTLEFRGNINNSIGNPFVHIENLNANMPSISIVDNDSYVFEFDELEKKFKLKSNETEYIEVEIFTDEDGDFSTKNTLDDDLEDLFIGQVDNVEYIDNNPYSYYEKVYADAVMENKVILYHYFEANNPKKVSYFVSNVGKLELDNSIKEDMENSSTFFNVSFLASSNTRDKVFYTLKKPEAPYFYKDATGLKLEEDRYNVEIELTNEERLKEVRYILAKEENQDTNNANEDGSTSSTDTETGSGDAEGGSSSDSGEGSGTSGSEENSGNNSSETEAGTGSGDAEGGTTSGNAGQDQGSENETGSGSTSEGEDTGSSSDTGESSGTGGSEENSGNNSSDTEDGTSSGDAESGTTSGNAGQGQGSENETGSGNSSSLGSSSNSSYGSGYRYVSRKTSLLNIGQWKYNEKTKIWNYFIKGNLLKDSWIKYKNYWFRVDSSGNMYENTWLKVDNSWFYAKKDGYILEKEWIFIDGKWYYAKEGGYIAINSWEKINNKWYYFHEDASLAVNTKIDKYFVNQDGEWIEEK